MMQLPATPSASTGAVVVAVPQPPPTVIGPDWSILIPLIFAGLAGLATSIIGTLKSYSNGRKNDAIHVLVNSTMSKTLTDLAVARAENQQLRDLLVSLSHRIAEGTVPSAIPEVLAKLLHEEPVSSPAHPPVKAGPLPPLPPFPKVPQ